MGPLSLSLPTLWFCKWFYFQKRKLLLCPFVQAGSNHDNCKWYNVVHWWCRTSHQDVSNICKGRHYRPLLRWAFSHNHQHHHHQPNPNHLSLSSSWSIDHCLIVISASSALKMEGHNRPLERQAFRKLRIQSCVTNQGHCVYPAQDAQLYIWHGTHTITIINRNIFCSFWRINPH